MKKIFSLVASITCVLVISSSPILSSTIKAQGQELPAQGQEIPEEIALPDLVTLLTNAGFNVTSSSYRGTTIGKSIVATASSPVNLNTLPSLIPYRSAFHRVLTLTFTVDSSQLSSFKEKFQQFQQKFGSHLRVTQVAEDVFKTTNGWTSPELEVFKAYFAPLSNYIHVQTISAYLSLTKVDKARIFYVNLQKSSPKHAEKLQELAKLDRLLKGNKFRITISSTQQEMQARSTGLPMNLQDFPDLSFYRDKLVFTFMVDPDSDKSHLFWKKFRDSRKKYPPVSLINNGFKTTRGETTQGWMIKDLNRFKEEFRSFSNNIYVAEINASLFTSMKVIKNALDDGLVENHSAHPYVDAMQAVIGAAKESIFHPILPPYYNVVTHR